MELFNVISQRFSCRKYLEKQISDEDLDKILKAGMHAPIGRGKYDEMHITVIQSNEVLNKINTLTDGSVFYNAPTLIIISGKDDGYHLIGENSACVAENMLLMATSLGLGSIYLNLVIQLIKGNKEVLSLLNLPEGFVPCVGVGLGYIDGESLIKNHKIEIDYI